MTSQGWWLAAVLAVSLALSAAAQGGGTAASPPASCATKLIGCVNYINGTIQPPPACCDPLKEAVTNERDCLCSIYNNSVVLEAAHINITQALNLPKLCHIDTGKSPNICEGQSPSSSTGSGSSHSGNGAGEGIRNYVWITTLIGLVTSLHIVRTYSLL